MKRILIGACIVLGVFLTARLFVEVAASAPQAGGGAASQNGDVNGSGRIDLSDAVYLLSYLFLGGSEPVALGDSPEILARVAALESDVRTLREGLPAGGDGAFTALAVLLDPAHPPEPLPAGTLQEIACGKGAEPPCAFLLGGEFVGPVQGFVIREQISSPYEVLAAVRVSAPTLREQELLGRAGKIVLRKGGPEIAWSGLVSEARLAAVHSDRAVYAIRLAPPLARLERNRGFQIFTDKSVPNIVRQVLLDAGLPADESRLSGSHSPREYAVQYDETDLSFVKRLLEDEGIFFFFREGPEGPVLVLGDSAAAYDPATVALPYRGHEAPPAAPGEETIRTFARAAREFTGTAVVRDYSFVYGQIVEGSASDPAGLGELAEYPSGIPNVSAASIRAKVRLEELVAEQGAVDGTSNAAGLKPGQRISIKDSTSSRFSGEYLVTAVTHTFVQGQNPDGTACYRYGNLFRCIPGAQAFRPPRSTPKPKPGGPCTAEVTGPAGQEIHVDKYGRVKVRFHWDRISPADEKSSAWIRVAVPLAGKSHGLLCLPEVGDEVLVAFESGDVDRPLVIGSLWNSMNMPPVSLPAGQLQTLLRTSRKGAAAGLENEILLSDAPGAEALRLRSAALDLAAPQTTVQGALSSTANAPAGSSISPGDRYRDNSIVAWALVDSTGKPGGIPFGVRQCVREEPGQYLLSLSARAESPQQLIPVATLIQLRKPAGPEDLRTISVLQVDSNAFRVFIYNALARPVDNDFTFLVTAR